MKQVYANCTVYDGVRLIPRGSVIIEGTRFAGVAESGSLLRDARVTDLDGYLVCPGFIDLQVNGGGGVLFNDSPTPAALETIAATHLAYGTTGFLATIVTASTGVMLEGISAAREYIEGGGRGVLGLHLEGPYLNPLRKGVHNPGLIRALTVEEIDRLLDLGSGLVKMVTLAPEMVEPGVIEKFREAGVTLAAGHTDATYRQAEEFAARGGTVVTHLFNAMSQFGSREPGMVGAAFDIPALHAGIIVDGFHVDYAAVRTAWRLMGSRLFLVSDAVSPLGSGDSSFLIGGHLAQVEDGACRTAAGVLAGSVLDMASAVRNCVHRVGIPLKEALAMASAGPAALLGMEREHGFIRPGLEANMVILDHDLGVSGVVSGGRYHEPCRLLS